MFQVRKRGQVGYEDLLREMEAIEHQLLSENSSLAMNLMVLEAKMRERFQALDRTATAKITDDLMDDLTMDDLHAMIPRELPLLPTIADVGSRRRRKKTLETVGMAALLAMGTALGVFGLASILQLALAWVA